jgi:hypothetical protein
VRGFDREIEPVLGLAADEGPREPDWEKIRSLPPLLEGGRLTAAFQVIDLPPRSDAASHSQQDGPRTPIRLSESKNVVHKSTLKESHAFQLRL